MNNNKFEIIVCGLPGSGKTSISKKIVGLTGAVLFRTDIIRKELIEKPTYSNEELTYINEQLILRANSLLQDSKSVVLGALFWSNKYRENSGVIALKNNANFKIIEVKCEEDKLKERIEVRSGDASDANFAVYQLYKNKFEPISEDHTIIDNSGALEDTYEQTDVAMAKL